MKKATGGDGIPAELLNILKDDVLKVLNMSASLENSSVHRTGKLSFHSSPKKGIDKECSSYCTIALISHARKVYLVTKSCPTLCNPMDYSLPGSSVHGS